MRLLSTRALPEAVRALALSPLIALYAIAQTSGSVSGVVEDLEGRRLAGVRVNLTAMETGAAFTPAISTRTGGIRFASLAPARYAVTVEAAGFKNLTLENIKVYPAAETWVRIRLTPGGGSLVFDGGALSPRQTTVTPIAAVVTREGAAGLPLTRWEASSLLELLPGVQRNGRAPLSIYGESASLGSVTYAGIDAQKTLLRSNPPEFATPNLRTGLVDDAFVVTGSIAGCGCARAGFTAPSGSNARHGSAYALLQPAATAAQDWNENSRNTPSRRRAYELGGAVGGPLKRNRVFYYGAVEGSLDRSTVTRTGPAPREPLASHDPLMQRLLDLIPADPSGTYRGRQRSGGSHAGALGRIDYAASPRHQVGVTFLASHTAIDDSADSSTYGESPTTRLNLGSRIFAATWRWTPNAHLTNELRAGGAFSRFAIENALRSEFPFIAILRDPRIDVSQPMQGLDPRRRSDDVYSLQDDLNLSAGRHGVSGGFSFQQHRLNAAGAGQGVLDSEAVPRYVIGDVSEGGVVRASQKFNLTSPSSGYLAGTPAGATLATKMLSGYLHDAWRALPALTLNLGVRFDWLAPAQVERGAAIIPALSATPSESVYDKQLPFIFAGRNFYRNDLTNYAIYVGLAWKPARELPLVVRGSAHLSSLNDDLLGNMSFFALNNPFQNLDVSADLSGGPATLSSKPATERPTAPSQWNLSSLMALARKYGIEPGAVYGINPQLATPNIKYWNIGVESELKGFAFDVRYLGNLLEEGARSVDRNQVMTYRGDYLERFKQVRYELQNGLPTAGFPRLQGGGLCLNLNLQNCKPDLYARSLIVTGQAGELGRWYESQEYGVNVYNLLGNPVAPRGINIMSHMGVSRFDGLQLTVSRNTARGLSVQASYLFSKVMSNLNDYRPGAVDPFLDVNNSSLEWAPSPFDLKHAFKAAIVQDLPFHAGAHSVAGSVLRNWSVAGTVIAQSGAPFSLLSGGYVTSPEGEVVAVSGLGTMTSLADSGQNTVVTAMNGRQIRGALGIHKAGDGTVSYVNAAADAFRQPEPGGLGNLQRRMFSGPGALSVNLGLRRSFRIHERMRMEVRAEAVNLLNRVNWLVRDQALMGTNTQSSTAVFNNDVQQWNSPRTLQFSLRLMF